jgi:hypothetical protein
MTLLTNLGLNGNPFEHYTAEAEPDIAAYAVRPPYLKAISDRANGLSSFILFGDRGAGKSATRLTVYKEIWNDISARENSDKTLPFAVNLTDYTRLQTLLQKDKLTERDIISVVAFTIIEQLLVWLASLEDDDRNDYIKALDKAERTLAFALIEGFYLSVSDLDREVSTTDTLKLLNSAWTTKSAIWTNKHWAAISKVLASAVNALSKKELDSSADISVAAEALLKSLKGESANAPKAVLTKLVELVQSFGFSGICVLVDKVDETPATTSSAEATAKLVHPVLAHIQLMEVAGFSWIFFLWANLAVLFDEKYRVRLDKIAHSTISWSEENLVKMLDNRAEFFSNGKLLFKDFFDETVDVSDVQSQILALSQRSPRELIKLMDTIFREHDARSNPPQRLDADSLTLGMDRYSTQTIGQSFPKKQLDQVLRVGKVKFVNKDVQQIYKIGDQGARVKIKTWQDAGLVKQDGTLPSEEGSKQAYLFAVADARIKRIINRRLDEIVGVELQDEDNSIPPEDIP